MTRGRWAALILLAALAGGIWYAHDAGHIARAGRDYAEWAETRRLAAEARSPETRPTLLDLGLDKVAQWVPGR